MNVTHQFIYEPFLPFKLLFGTTTINRVSDPVHMLRRFVLGCPFIIFLLHNATIYPQSNYPSTLCFLSTLFSFTSPLRGHVHHLHRDARTEDWSWCSKESGWAIQRFLCHLIAPLARGGSHLTYTASVSPKYRQNASPHTLLLRGQSRNSFNHPHFPIYYDF